MKTKYLLLPITLIALLLRLYQVNNYPPLLWDEASLGYNAYSILKTARDEYGTFLPLIFKSFGDYKPGLYVYLTTPFIALLGLTPLAVRLPSIILGSLLPYFLYLLIREINPKSKKTALFSALVLAFNPINIHFSRGAWETNILTVELVLASLFFFKRKYLLSALIFASTLYTYQGGKLASLLLITILLITQLNFSKPFSTVILNLFQDLKRLSKPFILPLFILALPIAYGLFFSSDSNRLKVISLFSYPRNQTETQQIISESNQLDYQLFHNHFIFFFRNFTLRYFNHFSPALLAFVGDWQNPRHSAPYIGILLYPSLIFFIIGLFSKAKKLKKFFLLWLLLAPIPAALTRDSVQTVRAMSFSIPLVFFVSLGLSQLKNRYLKIFIFLVYLLSFVYYSDLYYNHMVKTNPMQFIYGQEQAIKYLVKKQVDYQQIYFTDFYGQPYIYYLFYSQYPPQKYQTQANLTENEYGDAGTVQKIDNIRFVSTPSPDSLPPHSLAIYSHDELLRLNLNPQNILPLSPINNISTFYAYHN
ncbi:glycosyltransferase family 39 protein [Patescibacteria group bacterium]|nr:glycosyltransferase family 39 protein [Patescibacteria group bacterium]